MMPVRNLQLCREEIHLQGEALLGIHSNVAGDGYDFTDGHAWISVASEGRVIFLGLWPDGHPRVIEKREECSDVRVDMELGARPKVSRYYALRGAQLTRLNAFINRPDVWSYFNNCAAWATKLLVDVVGVRLPSRDYGVISTPRELGKVLMELEKQVPTSPYSPRAGEFQEPINRSLW